MVVQSRTAAWQIANLGRFSIGRVLRCYVQWMYYAIIGSGNDLLPVRRQAITRTYALLLSLGTLEQISVKVEPNKKIIQENAFKNVVCKILTILLRHYIVIASLGINFSKILKNWDAFLFRKMHSKISSANCHLVQVSLYQIAYHVHQMLSVYNSRTLYLMGIWIVRSLLVAWS